MWNRKVWRGGKARGSAIGSAMNNATTRDTIKMLALQLLIQQGYRGLNFRDIAEGLDITRANIHYHFGNKQMLVEEVLNDYVDGTLTALDGIWTTDRTFSSKIDAMIAYSKERYRRQNPPGTSGRPWSLISRLRQDTELLTPAGRESLQRFGMELTRILVESIEHAKAKGEFGPRLPVEDVALHLATLASNAAPITIEAGGFDRLERLYKSYASLVLQAFRPR